MAQDLLLFARQFFESPFQVAALSPSSQRLGRAMAAGLGAQTGRVVEFGPGTGQLTRGILAAGVAAENLVLVEMNADFAALLAQRFPTAQLHRAGAQHAASFVAEDSVDAVISGLPLLSMPNTVVESILGAAFRILRRGGEMRQFTYGHTPPVPIALLQKLGLVALRGKKVWLNVPPARVYTFMRAADL